ncbi:hypothetical protein SAMN05444354_108276 [Stigmatella aurantiaca]|uniref:Uncharacterized protein n=1 Tax=Stigmatella aurantiaca TaxID=41 RepID=A0A1H7T4X2_STIAU|nr:hypothetical protein [Stigmatella aurantiaca]SEL79891.1 hypothetical protein SAMN05444354_108276 [Stigmatella aurantiaca]
MTTARTRLVRELSAGDTGKLKAESVKDIGATVRLERLDTRAVENGVTFVRYAVRKGGSPYSWTSPAIH